MAQANQTPGLAGVFTTFSTKTPKVWADIDRVRAEMLGVSTDTFFALKAWGDQQKLNFPLLSDYNKDVIRKYGVVNPDMIGLKDIAKRAVFVIDRSGTVRHREVLDDARNEPKYEDVKKALASL